MKLLYVKFVYVKLLYVKLLYVKLFYVKFVCVEFVYVKLLYVKLLYVKLFYVKFVCVEEDEEEEAEEEQEAEEPGIQNQKQEPHTKMWGKKCSLGQDPFEASSCRRDLLKSLLPIISCSSQQFQRRVLRLVSHFIYFFFW